MIFEALNSCVRFISRLYQQVIMNKCEHGEKITSFCASECCVWKEAAGCQACIKKYHNHMGTTVFLTEEDVAALVKKYTMDSSIKPKCRVLQQAIYAYFNLIKTELSNSLDAACKNIINQIGYPYLYTNGTLSTYKRLKNKEYKKLIQKDFRALYDLSQKINEKDLARQQAKIYVNEMKMTEDLIGSLEDLIRKYEHNIKKYHPSFTHDTTHIFKINEIFKNLSESPRNSQLKGKEDKKQFSPVYPHKDKMEKSKESDIFKIEPVSILSTPSNNTERMPAIGAPPNLSRPNYSREVSLDKKIVHEPRFGGKGNKQSVVKQVKQSPRQQGKQSPTSHKNERMEVVRQELNNKEHEINQKKKILMQMMKTKQDKPKDDKSNKQKFYETMVTQPKEQKNKQSIYSRVVTEPKQQTLSRTITQSRETVLSRPKVLDFKTLSSKQYESKTSQDSPNRLRTPSYSQGEKQAHSNQELSSQDEGEEQHPKMEVQNGAFTQLPVEEKAPKTIQEMEPVKEKVIVIPTNNVSNESFYASPLYKIKTILDKYKDVSNMTESGINRLIRGEETKPPAVAEKDQSMLDLIPIYHKKTETNMELKENEEKSLALLLKSIHLKAEEAVVYLEKAILCADNNLSAAEYLSFLYLELDRPSQCLKLCNKMLEKLENSSQPEQLSLILNNNKASAWNILGRYSESIVLLEKCLRYREKDYFYKNLGDAYYSISIYEKAIYNYEKALKLNDHHDEAHYNLAVCLYIQENYQFAKLSILKAIEINSSNESYHELSRNIDTRINHY